MTLTEIPVKVLDTTTGMATALMSELRDHLITLAETGENSIVDLLSLPMTEADLDELADNLGVGEIRATINNIGTSSVRETAFRGIWWVTHYGDDGKVISEQIEITRIPEILITHVDEIKHSAKLIAAS